MARKKDERAPQWGSQETADFVAICAKLEQGLTQPNQTAWKTIASHMRQKGYRRSAAQCKCKWRYLVNSFKGKESMDHDSSRQSPYFEELRAIFKSQSKKIDKLSLELESEPRRKKKARTLDRSSEEFSEEEDDDDESEVERIGKSKKKKLDRERKRATAEKCRANNMQMVLEHFFQQQQRLELKWRETLERREKECRKREQEYRNVMASLESESFVREQHWHDQHDEWRLVEEARADQRDLLFSAILDQLVKREL